MATGPGWTRLSRHVTRRRVELGMRSQRALAEKSGLTERVIWKVERGISISRTSLATLDAALGWATGSSEEVVFEDGEPRLAAPDDERPQVVIDHWDDPDVRMLWELPVSAAQRLAYIRAHVALADSGEVNGQAAG